MLDTVKLENATKFSEDFWDGVYSGNPYFKLAMIERSDYKTFYVIQFFYSFVYFICLNNFFLFKIRTSHDISRLKYDVLVEYTLLKPNAASTISEENLISEIQIYPTKESGLEDHDDIKKQITGLCGMWFKSTSEPYCEKKQANSCDNFFYDSETKCINCIELAEKLK